MNSLGWYFLTVLANQLVIRYSLKGLVIVSRFLRNLSELLFTYQIRNSTTQMLILIYWTTQPHQNKKPYLDKRRTFAAIICHNDGLSSSLSWLTCLKTYSEVFFIILAEIKQTLIKIYSIELLNNKLHGLLPPGGLVSPPGGFASLSFDQGVP